MREVGVVFEKTVGGCKTEETYILLYTLVSFGFYTVSITSLIFKH